MRWHGSFIELIGAFFGCLYVQSNQDSVSFDSVTD